MRKSTLDWTFFFASIVPLFNCGCYPPPPPKTPPYCCGFQRVKWPIFGQLANFRNLKANWIVFASTWTSMDVCFPNRLHRHSTNTSFHGPCLFSLSSLLRRKTISVQRGYKIWAKYYICTKQSCLFYFQVFSANCQCQQCKNCWYEYILWMIISFDKFYIFVTKFNFQA